MKPRRFNARMMLVCVVFFAAHSAQAFYNPSTGRWLSRDPLGEQGFGKAVLSLVGAESLPGIEETKPSYLFVENALLTQYDVLGLWPSMHHWLVYRHGPLVHRNAVDRQILDLSQGDRDWLVTSVEYVDMDQDTSRSYRHAMSAPNESPGTAKNRANFWVRLHIITAQEALCEACSEPGAQRHRTTALWEFGQALHTIQDATSPAHAGFQTWRGLGHPFEANAHLTKESFDPGSNSKLDKATAWLWTFFTCIKSSPPLPSDFFRGLGYDHAPVGE